MDSYLPKCSAFSRTVDNPMNSFNPLQSHRHRPSSRHQTTTPRDNSGRPSTTRRRPQAPPIPPQRLRCNLRRPRQPCIRRVRDSILRRRRRHLARVPAVGDLHRRSAGRLGRSNSRIGGHGATDAAVVVVVGPFEDARAAVRGAGVGVPGEGRDGADMLFEGEVAV